MKWIRMLLFSITLDRFVCLFVDLHALYFILICLNGAIHSYSKFSRRLHSSTTTTTAAAAAVKSAYLCTCNVNEMNYVQLFYKRPLGKCIYRNVVWVDVWKFVFTHSKIEVIIKLFAQACWKMNGLGFGAFLQEI